MAQAWRVDLATAAAACSVAAVALAGCGPSERELALYRQVSELQGELFDAKQRAEDLKVRMYTIRARNKVLISLVAGLTGDASAGQDIAQAPSALVPAQQALSELDRDLEILAASLQRSRHDFARLRGERERLRSTLDEALATIEAAEQRQQRARARLETFRSMQSQLRSKIARAQLDVRVADNQLVIRLPKDTLFASGRAQLLDSGSRLLDEVAQVLATIYGRSFQVVTRSSDRPARRARYGDAFGLAAARAVSVGQHLVARGIEAARISAAAMAKHGEGEDDRIEVVLLPNVDELPDLSWLLQAEPEKSAGEAPANHGDAPPPY